MKCPTCSTEINITPVQDIVLAWSANVFMDKRPMVAGLTPDGAVVLGLTNQDNKRIYLSIQLGVPMPQLSGEDVAFQLVQIHPGVIKLSSSVFDRAIHAYITIVGVPDLKGQADGKQSYCLCATRSNSC